MYEYSARVLRVVDADTVHLDVDLGFDVRRKDSFRLYGLNAPEMNTPEGVAARDWLVARLAGAANVVVVTTVKDRREKYGRYLGVLWLESGESINQELLDEGHAVPMGGRG